MMTIPDLALVVTIDVEEDNWGFHGSELSVENIRKIPVLQNLFDRYGVRPTYLVTYPVASCGWAAGILSRIQADGGCEIGAHLHPWNTPPLQEERTEKNSMLKNLPYELQAAKLSTLTEKITGVFGRPPRSFRAGRWALGRDTVKALMRHHYLTDCSVTPTVSWLHHGEGSAYENPVTEPYWLDPEGQNRQDTASILEVPATIGFNRWPFELFSRIHAGLQHDWLRFMRPIGVMHHSGLLRKIWLSPEVSSTADMIVLSRTMIRNGLRHFNLNFHSTTLLPGKSPFVKSQRDLEHFYRKIETLLEYLLSEARVTSLTLSEVRQRLDPASRTRTEQKSHCAESPPFFAT